MSEVWKYWAHVWNQSGRKCVVIFWNAVILGEHLVYKSKHDAMHQGKKRSFETEPKLSFQLNFIQPALMRKNLLNWCHLVSISKNIVFYASLVVRIY